MQTPCKRHAQTNNHANNRSGLHQWQNCFLAHERLAIIDPASGDQPLFNEDRSICVAVNGEIYNHLELKAQIKAKHPGKKFRTESDCEVISHLYEDHGEGVAAMLDGMFSFVLLDQNTNSFLVARDPIGITSLYIGWGRDGATWVASEMKCLKDECVRFQQFPPGHYYSSRTGEFTRYYNPQFYLDFEAAPPVTPSAPYDPVALRRAFEAAVEKRMMSDVPFGVLLSGGLDSSLVAAIAARKIARDGGSKWGRLHSFCIGLEGSPDLAAARAVADFLKTDHFEFTFTVQEGIDAVSDVIAHVETYDVTTIRASTPMFLMSRKIKALGVKMVLSGEGSDEVFGGYLYFHKAPSREEFFQETVRKVQALHQFDCLRANKSTMAWGVEARVPFLDRGFLDTAMAIDPAEKMIDKAKGRIEKYILRKVRFAVQCEGAAAVVAVVVCVGGGGEDPVWRRSVLLCVLWVVLCAPLFPHSLLHNTNNTPHQLQQQYKQQPQIQHKQHKQHKQPHTGVRHAREPLPARQRALAPEGAVQRRRRLLVDRRPQGARRRARDRPAARGGAAPLPRQHAAHQGGLPLPHDLRGPLPAEGGRRHGAGRPLGRVQHGDGGAVGRGVGGQGGSVGARGRGRARQRVRRRRGVRGLEKEWVWRVLAAVMRRV